MSNVALSSSFVRVCFYLLHLFNFCFLHLFIYFVLGYHIRWWNKVVYKTPAVSISTPLAIGAVDSLLWERGICSHVYLWDRNVRRILVRGGQCPLAAWEENFENEIYSLLNDAFWTISEYECGQHSAVLYTCLPLLLSKYNINIENCSFSHVSLFNCSSILPGVSWPHLPLCADAHAPWLRVKT